MYQNFIYETPERRLAGYHWPVESPKAVMCIIHGIGEYAGRYDRMAGILNEAGIGVLCMDLPGHGLTKGKRGHIGNRDVLLNDISIMIGKAEELYPDVPITLYGHSMGGNICLDYKSRGSKNDVPVKYIVSGPWLKLVQSVPKPLVKIVKRIAKVSPTIAMSSNCNEEDLGNMDVIKIYKADPLVHPNITISTASDCIEVADAILNGTHPDNGKTKGKPFLLMHGSDDKICDVRGSRKLAEINSKDPSFRYIEWEGYYHEIHNGGPNHTGEEVIETIKNFVLE